MSGLHFADGFFVVLKACGLGVGDELVVVGVDGGELVAGGCGLPLSVVVGTLVEILES